MPDAFGNETPQEIIARLQQQKATTQRTFAGGGGVGALRSNVQDIFSDIGASLDLKGRRTVDEGLADARVKAQSRIDALPEDATELDRQIAIMETQLAEVGPLDTNVATGLTDQLLKATVQRDEQRRLQGKAAREESEFASGAEPRNVFMVVDPNTGMAVDQVDLRSEGDIAKLRELQAQNPQLAIQAQDDFLSDRAADRLALARIDAANVKTAADRSDIGATTRKNELSRESKANVRLAIGVGDLMDLAIESPAAFGFGGAAASGLNKLGAHARSVVQAVNPDAFQEDRSKAEEILLRNNIAAGQKQSLILDLAYAIASSREGGRLTDQDVERAIQTLGGDQPDPRAFAAVLMGLTNRSATLWKDRLRTAGLSDNTQAQEMHQVAQEHFDGLTGRFDSLQKSLGIDDAASDKFLDEGIKTWDEFTEEVSGDAPAGTGTGTAEDPLDFFRTPQ